MVETEVSNGIGRIRIKVTQQAKKEVCEFTVEVGAATGEQMQAIEDIAWESVRRMVEDRNSLGFTTDA